MPDQRGADCDLTPGRGWFISSRKSSKYLRSRGVFLTTATWIFFFKPHELAARDRKEKTRNYL
jgi:hypothetical protein